MPLALATPHALATDAGERAFEAGGNAIDAALASAAVLTVAYPHMCSIGGDLWALVVDPDGKATVVDGSGVAPARTSPEGLREKYDQMPATGPDTITVPGVLRGWTQLGLVGSRLDNGEILSEAISHASDGVPVTPSLARAILDAEALMEKDSALRSLLVAGGEPKSVGELLAQPELASSLEAIASNGDAAFYGGPIGQSFCGDLAEAGSRLDIGDLIAHRGRLVEPLSMRFGDLEVLTSPPSSQGLLLLEILSAHQLLSRDGDVGSDVLARLFSLASVDRDRYLADPDFSDVPVRDLLSPGHIERMADAARSNHPQKGAGVEANPHPGGDTVAVVAVDSEGWAVSLIQSVFFSFGSGIVSPETGILCHNRGACFSLDPDSPNRIEPGKRPMHTLMPVIARKSPDCLAAVGTMGGRAQPQILTQVLLGFSDGVQAGHLVSAPRFIVEGDGIFAESSLEETKLSALQDSTMKMGLLRPLDESVGHSQIAIIDGDRADAASDPRSDGSAVLAHRPEIS